MCSFFNNVKSDALDANQYIKGIAFLLEHKIRHY